MESLKNHWGLVVLASICVGMVGRVIVAALPPQPIPKPERYLYEYIPAKHQFERLDTVTGKVAVSDSDGWMRWVWKQNGDHKTAALEPVPPEPAP